MVLSSFSKSENQSVSNKKQLIKTNMFFNAQTNITSIAGRICSSYLGLLGPQKAHLGPLVPQDAAGTVTCVGPGSKPPATTNSTADPLCSESTTCSHAGCSPVTSTAAAAAILNLGVYDCTRPHLSHPDNFWGGFDSRNESCERMERWEPMVEEAAHLPSRASSL
jgi:hypothetical protein